MANPWLDAFLDEPDPIGAIGAIGMAINQGSDRPPPPSEWVEGLALLSAVDPPLRVPPLAWRERVGAAVRFANSWGGVASACGWPERELFSLHPLAPMLRFDAMGTAFLTAGVEVVALTDETIALRGVGGAVRRARRGGGLYPAAWLTFCDAALK